MISAAPSPSNTDHPRMRIGRDLASAVVAEPHPYTTQPIMNARLRPMICPTLPPVIMNAAMTSV